MEAISTLKEPGGSNKTNIASYIEVFLYLPCGDGVIWLEVNIIVVLPCVVGHKPLLVTVKVWQITSFLTVFLSILWVGRALAPKLAVVKFEASQV